MLSEAASPISRTPEQRRHIRKSAKTENAGPDGVVRRILLTLGYRYRLHPKKKEPAATTSTSILLAQVFLQSGSVPVSTPMSREAGWRVRSAEMTLPVSAAKGLG